MDNWNIFPPTETIENAESGENPIEGLYTIKKLIRKHYV